MKKRNHAFDLLCGICIIRMVSLHAMQLCGHTNDEWWKELMQWSYFFMSFFFFKAGYFNKSVTSLSTGEYIRDKAKRLLIPYLSAGIIGSVVYFSFYPFLMQRYTTFPAELSWEHIWQKSDFYGNPPTWFLFSFFCAYVAIHLLEKFRHWAFARRFSPRTTYWSSLFYVLFPLASYQLYLMGNPLWFSLNNIFMGIFFFELGRAWRRILAILNTDMATIVSIVLIVCFIVGNSFFHESAYTMSGNRFDGPFLPTMVNTVTILCGLSGLLITMQVPRIPLLNYIGEHSMVYFVGHFPILFYYKYMHLTFGRSIYGRYDHLLIILPAMFMICSWLVPYIEKFPVLSGRWPKK